MTDRLEARALGRATLARQWLLDRVDRGVLDAVEHLVGMQGQAPLAPYIGLWSRLRAADPALLAGLTTDRAVVRMPLLRATLHLVSAADAHRLRPLLHPVLERNFRSGSPFGRRLSGVDVDAVVAAGGRLIAERPRSRADLGRALARRWPDHDPAAMAQAVTLLLPVVQPPPRGVWGVGGPPVWTSVEAWLGRPDGPRGSLADLVLRYLAAFGPASVADIQAWCGLTRLGEVVEGLGGRLREFRDADGRALYDLPDAPRPDPDTPAPARLLGEFDNLYLAHADRSRVVADDRQVSMRAGDGTTHGTALVDGRYAADWDAAALRISPFGRLARTDRADLTAEAHRLAAFLRPENPPEVRVD